MHSMQFFSACSRLHGLMMVLMMTSLVSTWSVAADGPKVVFVAGRPSHGYGSHEHLAGCRVLADAIKQLHPECKITITENGWPKDETVFDGADAIVFYADGGQGHPLMGHFDALRPHINRGVGFVCIHYGVEIPPGTAGDEFKQWLGGYFETNYSVNPHWVAKYKELPKHPITVGVEPFEANDEWYYHMRFVDGMKGVTPILTALPPPETLSRKDGAHSGNPDVRRAIANGEPQHMAWAYERPSKGRSFGFTGGHYHWNWGRPEIRRLVANAILWTANTTADAKGSVKALGVEELSQGQDEPIPAKFDPKSIQNEFHLTASVSSATSNAAAKNTGPSKLLFNSPRITQSTPGHRVRIDVPLQGAKKLFLVVSDADDGFSCDWADWIDPQLRGKNTNRSLLDLKPVRAESQWGRVNMNRNAGDQPLSVNGEAIQVGIGTHANSVIEYDVPPGFDTFTAFGGLDNGGSDQNGGQATSVKFAVYADAIPEGLFRQTSSSDSDQRSPEKAVSGLTVADGLQVTLAAAEPQLKSLTNIDVDARGRVWVCDVMNYRRNAGRRPEGDRILILEDTNQDGVMDVVKTFYQGNDIDSAMGICVLGNQVIVSATPNIWRFVDDNGDDVPDRKEAIFTKTGQPQHDHSAHSFLFGPDGRLYWNFGNTGQAVHDAKGNQVVDIHGRPIVDNGKPFFGGMVFRCEADGSNMEVLGHNFRNNYEVTVDSFGRLWQSDNDDDGNRGVRINYVVEQGNYGYRDELTGATWQAERIGWESEIPLRHWHLNDPGVIPNLVQTGGGSPTGITVNEGSLLPAPFKNEVIHCDAGPNVVRAYPATKSGAGFTGTMANLIEGKNDQWFRPADVCVAPDGSLFVSDWYDPGVGGHRQEDLDRGRLFRVAPPGHAYQIPKFDYSTAEGAVAALRNPASSVRYLAWQALHGMGAKAEPALTKLWQDPDSRMRARALWLLGRIEGRGTHWVDQALKDSDADIRATGVRLARQLKMSAVEVAKKVQQDSDPGVRAEALVSLRFDKSSEMPKAWASLASKYDGKDRWYLEVLGLASDLRANECFASWQASAGDQLNTAIGRDIAWRVRADAAADVLVQAIQDVRLKLDETDRLFRALEYRQEAAKTAAFKQLLKTPAGSKAENQERSDAIVIRALERLPGYDWNADEHTRPVVERYAKNTAGTAAFLALAKRLALPNIDEQLITLAMSKSDQTIGVDAADVLLSKQGGEQKFAAALRQTEPAEQTARVARLLGLVGKPPAMKVLIAAMLEKDLAYGTRAEALRGACMSNLGQKRVIELTKENRFPADLKVLAGGLLVSSQDANIRQQAKDLFPLPKASDQAPLPPIDQLAKRSGDVSRGAELFKTKSTCANCHVVAGQGKAVGPDLSEIGSKLTREALYVSIVDPSAGISHNFENHIALLDSGQVIAGVLVTQDAESVTLRTAEAIDRKIPRNTIEELKKSDKSLMPENLHQLTDLQGLIDVVEYLVTLKKK